MLTDTLVITWRSRPTAQRSVQGSEHYSMSKYDSEGGRAEVMQELRKESRKGYGPTRIFDVVSPRTQEDRKREFFGALSSADQVLLKEARAEPVTAFQRRIDEIRRLQKEATQVFCSDAFMRLMLEKANESKLRANAAGQQVEGRIIFTHEAVLATQLITETYLVGLLKEANMLFWRLTWHRHAEFDTRQPGHRPANRPWRPTRPR